MRKLPIHENTARWIAVINDIPRLVRFDFSRDTVIFEQVGSVPQAEGRNTDEQD